MRLIKCSIFKDVCHHEGNKSTPIRLYYTLPFNFISSIRLQPWHGQVHLILNLLILFCWLFSRLTAVSRIFLTNIPHFVVLKDKRQKIGLHSSHPFLEFSRSVNGHNIAVSCPSCTGLWWRGSTIWKWVFFLSFLRVKINQNWFKVLRTNIHYSGHKDPCAMVKCTRYGHISCI